MQTQKLGRLIDRSLQEWLSTSTQLSDGVLGTIVALNPNKEGVNNTITVVNVVIS